MKTKILVFALFFLGLTACHKEEELSAVSSAEEANLTYLIQEEKLARDVYVFSYNLYGEAIFNNISSSEQNHMDKVATLLSKYSLANPIVGLDDGVFVDTELQSLYNDLIAQSEISLLEALKVGATIEDLDIHDIENLYLNTSNQDFIAIYDQLTCGSRNHIRSFVPALESYGGTYTVQFLSEAEYLSIINSVNESCGK